MGDYWGRGFLTVLMSRYRTVRNSLGGCGMSTNYGWMTTCWGGSAQRTSGKPG